jgi:PAS domain S-box-containing protein
MKHILLVEDDSAHAELIARAIETAGGEFQMAIAGSIAEARERIARQAPDLVLTDYRLPDGEGDQLVELGLERFPVVLMTAFGSEKIAVGAIKSGALDYIVKSPESFRDMRHLASRYISEWAFVVERKKAEGEIRRSRDFLEKLVSAVTDPVLVKERRHTIILANQAACEFLGQPRGEILGRTLCELIPGAASEQSRDADEQIFETGREKIHEETISDAANHPRVILTKTSRFDDLAGNLYLVSVIRDITDRVQADQQREALAAQLRQAQKMEAIGTLAGGIAHDFNNILAAIIGNTELAKMDTPENSPVGENLQNILAASNRARDLVQQILTFSRRREQERRPIRIELVISEAAKLLRSTIPAMVEINVSIEANTPYILADATQINQIIMNLATNAWHAMPESGGRIDLALSRTEVRPDTTPPHPDLREGVYTRLTVADNGHGMDPTIVDRVFEPFFTTKEPGQGTGLGLAVVHGIVKGHEGVIDLNSRVGKGTTFHIYLPGIRNQEAPTPQAAPSIPHGSGERILLVDDETSILTVTAEFLTRIGYQVTKSAKASEALQIFQAAPDAFDLVLSDFAMPELTGKDLAAKILSIRPDMPILLISGFVNPFARETARNLGVKDILLKPIDPRQLGSAVHSALAKDSSSQTSV